MTHPTYHPPPPPTGASAAGAGGRRRSVGAALRTVLLLAAWALLVMGSASAGAEVVDDLGRTVTVDRTPVRVVTMVPSHTEAVCALGRCDLLVGRDTFSNHPPRVLDLPDLGSAFAPDLEALVALQPDLVLVDEYSGLADALLQIGIPVYAGTPQSIEGIFDHLQRLGELLDARTEAAVVEGRIRGELAAVATIARGLEAPSVYYEIDASPYSVGPEGFVGSLIALAGGRNVVGAELGDFPLLDPEFVVAADPEVVVLASAPFGETIESLRARPGWSGIAALRTGRVAELTSEESDVLSRAGPRVGEAALVLARILHPGRF